MSKNWTEVPLDSIDTILNFLATTTMRTGLTVKATLVEKAYEKGLGFGTDEMKQLNLWPNETIPQWNYTIQPQPSGR